MGPVPGPHARTNRTRDTRVAEPQLAALKDGRPGERQRLTPDAPHTGGGPPPPGTPPHHPHDTQPRRACKPRGQWPHTRTPAPTARGWRTRIARPEGGQPGEGERLTSDAPHNGNRHPPQGTPSRRPQSAQRRPARADAPRPMLGPHAHTNRTWDTRVAGPRLPVPEDGRPRERQRLAPDAPHNGGRPPPRGTAPHRPRGTQPPQGTHAKGTVLGPHTRTLDNNAWRTPAPKVGGPRQDSARPRTPLATGSPVLHGRQGEHLMPTLTC